MLCGESGSTYSYIAAGACEKIAEQEMYSVTETSDSGNVPAFLKKLWTLVDDPSTDELIGWGIEGSSFHVFDQARFAREVLPYYFKHSNIASFIRQLNMYGFRKAMNVDQGALKVERDDLEFHHPFFVQGHEEMLENIKRKVSSNVKVESVRLKQEDVSKVLTDVRNLRGKQENISAKMDTLKRENEALWREVANLRQKHIKQQQIVNKLIQFLVTLVRGRGIPSNPRKRVMPLMLNDASQIAAKEPKLSRQLSIEEKNVPYSVTSPPSAPVVTDIPPSSCGPTIHEVTDILASSNPDVTEISTGNTLDGTGTEVNGVRSGEIPSSSLDLPLSSDLKPVNLSLDDSLDKKTVSLPSPTNPKSVVIAEKKDVTEQLDLLQTDLEELKSVLSGQYSLDPELLLGLFNPELSLTSLPDPILDTKDPVAKPSTTGPIVGNELIQYEPLDDLTNMPLFDLGDTELSMPGLESDTEEQVFTEQPSSNNNLESGLSTPQISLSTLNTDNLD